MVPPARSLFLSPQPPHNTEEERGEIQWNLYQADTFETFPSVCLIGGTHLIEVKKIAQCLLTINIQRLLCNVIQLHFVKEADPEFKFITFHY